MNKAVATLCLLGLLAGCEESPEYKQMKAMEHPMASTPATGAAATSTTRITVQRIDVIEDSVAYGDRRGVYLITDTQTGQTFIGVSGVGIAETGRHQVGKSSTTDER